MYVQIYLLNNKYFTTFLILKTVNPFKHEYNLNNYIFFYYKMLVKNKNS